MDNDQSSHPDIAILILAENQIIPLPKVTGKNPGTYK